MEKPSLIPEDKPQLVENLETLAGQEYNTEQVNKLAKKYLSKGKVKFTISPNFIRKIEITDRRDGKMKLTVKLNVEEAEGFKNFLETLKPEELTKDQFIKWIFMTGIESIGMKMESMVRQHLEAVGDASGMPNPELLRPQIAVSGA